MQTYDAVVIGAGPAGSTTALLLARAGWSVAIVEKSAFPRPKVCGEFISAPALGLLGELGLARTVLAEAGPAVREIGVYAGDSIVVSPMTRAKGGVTYGHALARDRLDSLLLGAAHTAGAAVYEGSAVEHFQPHGSHYVCRIRRPGSEGVSHIAAPVIIAAYGSSPAGRLPARGAGAPPQASDLLSFKARFARARLPAGRMSLVAFRGGYGGLVESDGDRVSFSCCVRRDVLAKCRAAAPHASAGAAVLAHVLASCRGAREALGDATPTDHWLGAAPIRPGMSGGYRERFFAVGNARGEAHPIIAEGISMAIQSAYLLSTRLLSMPHGSAEHWYALRRSYEDEYREAFAVRMRAAALFAGLAVRQSTAHAAARMLTAVPELLGYAVRCAGKVRGLPAGA